MASQIRAVCLAILAVFLAAGARAQDFGLEEGIKPDGSVRQEFALTAAQRRAIYNAVVQQGSRSSDTRIPVAIGARIPHSVELRDLPDQTAANVWTSSPRSDLKYAMVEDDVVVVDPLSMQVVDVIHGRSKP